MNTGGSGVFRPSALHQYSHNEERAVTPRFIRPPVRVISVALLALLVTGAWTARQVVLAVEQRDAPLAGARTQLVVARLDPDGRDWQPVPGGVYPARLQVASRPLLTSLLHVGQ